MDGKKYGLYRLTSSRFPGSVIFSYRNGILERCSNYAMLSTKQLTWLSDHFPMFESNIESLKGPGAQIEKMDNQYNSDLMLLKEVIRLENEKNTTTSPPTD